nr:protein shisa-3-like [Microcebus murinus]
MSRLLVMGKTQWSGLGLLLWASVLLLAMPRGVRPQGEFCHSWIDSAQLWHADFQCPEEYDKPTAIFCCGTCSLRYCCATLEARLDQGLCPEDVPLDSNEVMLPPPEGSVYLPLVIVGSTFVTFILLGVLAGVACFRCLRPQRRDELENAEPTVSSCNPTPRRNASQGPLLHSKPDVSPVLPFTTQEYPRSTILTIPTPVTRPLRCPLFGPPHIPPLYPSTTILPLPHPLAGKISYGPSSGPYPSGTLV